MTTAMTTDKALKILKSERFGADDIKAARIFLLEQKILKVVGKDYMIRGEYTMLEGLKEWVFFGFATKYDGIDFSQYEGA